MATEELTHSTELNVGVEKSDEATDLGNKYEIPEPEPFISFNALKDRIRHHYELASDYYYSLWYVPRQPLPSSLHQLTERPGASTFTMATSSLLPTRRRKPKFN
jgi:hypothetical protein